jgi:hypothetical protein
VAHEHSGEPLEKKTCLNYVFDRVAPKLEGVFSGRNAERYQFNTRQVELVFIQMELL